MRETNILQLIYTFFVGLLLALFIGAGINTFYTPPAAPEYPSILNIYGKEPTEQQLAVQKQFDQQNAIYQDKMKPYNRNVSIMTLVAAVAFLVVSVLFEKKIKFIANGIMLGGLSTLIYSIGRGFASEDSKYIFTAITVGLAIVLYLGYRRFVMHTAPTKES